MPNLVVEFTIRQLDMQITGVRSEASLELKLISKLDFVVPGITPPNGFIVGYAFEPKSKFFIMEIIPALTIVESIAIGPLILNNCRFI